MCAPVRLTLSSSDGQATVPAHERISAFERLVGAGLAG